MEIFIDDIPDEGLTIKAETAKEHWLKDIIKEVFADDFSDKDKASLVVTFIKCEENIDVRGEIIMSYHPACDRCLSVYSEKQKVTFHLTMAPLFESERERRENEDLGDDLVKEDLEFSYYESDRIDLSEMIREQLFLDRPAKHLCREDCKGICQKCGKNLNEGPCNCREESRDPRWDVLKDFKPAKKKASKAPKGKKRKAH